MGNHDVRHYLDIYTTRKEMQEEGITNPSEEIKKFTKDFVEKLQNMPFDEEIILKDSSLPTAPTQKAGFRLRMNIEK
jgi:hypothetical protein